MALNDTDNFVIGRGSETFKIEYSDLKSALNLDVVNLWKRTNTTLSPFNSNDNLDIAGSATFAGGIVSNGILSFEDTTGLKVQLNGDDSNYYGISKLAGSADLGDGELRMTAGNTGAGSFTVYTGPDEQFKIDNTGKSYFSQDATFGQSTADGNGVVIKSSGIVETRVDTPDPVFQAFSGGTATGNMNVQIKANGDAMFNGTLQAFKYDLDSLNSLP